MIARARRHRERLGEGIDHLHAVDRRRGQKIGSFNFKACGHLDPTTRSGPDHLPSGPGARSLVPRPIQPGIGRARPSPVAALGKPKSTGPDPDWASTSRFDPFGRVILMPRSSRPFESACSRWKPVLNRWTAAASRPSKSIAPPSALASTCRLSPRMTIVPRRLARSSRVGGIEGRGAIVASMPMKNSPRSLALTAFRDTGSITGFPPSQIHQGRPEVDISVPGQEVEAGIGGDPQLDPCLRPDRDLLGRFIRLDPDPVPRRGNIDEAPIERQVRRFLRFLGGAEGIDPGTHEPVQAGNHVNVPTHEFHIDLRRWAGVPSVSLGPLGQVDHVMAELAEHLRGRLDAHDGRRDHGDHDHQALDGIAASPGRELALDQRVIFGRELQGIWLPQRTAEPRATS